MLPELQPETAAPGDTRIGVLGGTFDPIHLGHLRIAETAQKSLGLDKVLFIPVGIPVHRRNPPRASAEHRYAMCALAVKDFPGFEVSRLETDTPRPCFTVDTLARLRQERPHAELRLIIGADEAAIFTSWREPRTILKQARLAIATRPGLTAAQLRSILPRWVQDSADILPPLNIDISATDVRTRLAEGRTVQQLLPAEVITYIEQNALYRP